MSIVPEADEVLAPLVFSYIVGVVVTLLAIIAWVFWFRGYA
ncbi:MAG: hypothetical protein NZS48_01860 [Gemmata sp.]|nr:hypothetical protein [Gemmata sp.]